MPNFIVLIPSLLSLPAVEVGDFFGKFFTS